MDETSLSEAGGLDVGSTSKADACWAIENFSKLEKSTELVNCRSKHFFLLKLVRCLDSELKINMQLIDGLTPVKATTNIEITCFSASGDPLQSKSDFTFSKENNNVDIPFGIKQSELLTKGYVEDDQMLISIEVTVQQLPQQKTKLHQHATCTEYNGLINQGSTCYMNSLLQSMFHLPLFRKQVYQIATTEPVFDPNSHKPQSDFNNQKKAKLVQESLQVLFAKMQLNQGTIDTHDFTHSLGMSESDLTEQKDIEEFSQSLLDKIQQANLIFKGRSRYFIRCKNIDDQSSKEDDFFSISVMVKDCNSLQESLDKFIQIETLDGDNMYQTEKHGKQVVDLGTEFVSFPPVLYIHLKRFEYDFERNENIKINTKFSFPTELSLDKYLAANADHSIPQNYELFGVIVHSGSPNFGHYYTYCRPNNGKQWIKFNDTSVTCEDSECAIEDNFGGPKYDGIENKMFSAYLLMYVRKSDIEEIFKEVTKNDIPEFIQKKIEEQEVSRTASAFYNFYSQSSLVKRSEITPLPPPKLSKNTKKIFRTESLSNEVRHSAFWFDHAGIYLTNFEPTMTYKQLYEAINDSLGFNVDMAQIWGVHTHFPTEFIELDDTEKTCQKFADFSGFYVDQEYSFDFSLNPTDTNYYIVFIYLYMRSIPDPLRFFEHFNASNSKTVDYVISEVEKKIGETISCCYVNQDDDLIPLNSADKTAFLADFAKERCVSFVFTPLLDPISKIENSDRLRAQPKNCISASCIQNYIFPPDVQQFIIGERDPIRIQCQVESNTAKYISFPPDISGTQFFDFITTIFDVKFDENEDSILIYLNRDRQPTVLQIDSLLIEQIQLDSINLMYIVFVPSSQIQSYQQMQRIEYNFTKFGSLMEKNYVFLPLNAKVGELVNQRQEYYNSNLLPIKEKGHRISQVYSLEKPLSDVQLPIVLTCSILRDTTGDDYYFSFISKQNREVKYINHPFVFTVHPSETVPEVALYLNNYAIKHPITLYATNNVYGLEPLPTNSTLSKALGTQKHVFIEYA